MDPAITLDLGREVPVDTIVLVPTQPEFLEDSGIFPKRFTLELSNRTDFAQRTIVFTPVRTAHLPPDRVPVTFMANHPARYVRLTVQEGHHKGTLDLFGLSEFIVISQGEPVSFGATVTTEGDFDARGSGIRRR